MLCTTIQEGVLMEARESELTEPEVEEGRKQTNATNHLAGIPEMLASPSYFW